MTFQPARFIPRSGHPDHACAFTARFHPYRALRRDGIVSVTLSVPAESKAHLLDGTVLYAVRTFLPQ